jgi:hypothetical protein
VPVRLTVLVVAEGRTLDRRAAELDRAAGALVGPTTLATLRAAVAADADSAQPARGQDPAGSTRSEGSATASEADLGAGSSTGEGRDLGDDPWPDDDLQLDDL